MSHDTTVPGGLSMFLEIHQTVPATNRSVDRSMVKIPKKKLLI
jgi:hypothetical protein